MVRLELETETRNGDESNAMVKTQAEKAADDALVARLRPMMKRRKGCEEKKMFGGVCFFIHGNMCCGSWKGSLVLRLDREQHEDTQLEPFVSPMNITGKTMRGWAIIHPDGIQHDDDLRDWLDRAVKFARSLEPKD